MSLKYNSNLTTAVLVVLDGKPYNFRHDHPYFGELLAALQDEDEVHVRHIVNRPVEFERHNIETYKALAAAAESVGFVDVDDASREEDEESFPEDYDNWIYKNSWSEK